MVFVYIALGNYKKKNDKDNRKIKVQQIRKLYGNSYTIKCECGDITSLWSENKTWIKYLEIF